MHTFFIFFGLLAGAFAFEGVLDVETRDELGSIRDRLKSCFGIEKWVWMTKMNSKADVENCVKTVTGTDDAGPYLQCIGLKTGWYKAGGWSKGRKGIFRSSGDNLLGCIIKSETWCPSRREVEDEEEEEEEEIVDIESRGLFPKKYLDPLKDCLGSIRNKFLTEVKDLSGFGRCLRQLCPSYTDSVIKGTASCLNLTPGMGPGPNCDYHDFWNKEKMMIQNNRGKLGFCIREQRTKCQ